MWQKIFGGIGIECSTRNSQHDAEVSRSPLGRRQDLSRERSNDSRGVRCFDGYLDGDRDGGVGNYRRFSFTQGLPLIESPSMRFQWENLLEKPANLGGNGKSTMDCPRGYDADISRTDTEKGYTQSGFMGMVPKSMSMANKRTGAFLPSTSEFGSTNIPSHIDGGFSSAQGNLNVEFQEENRERFSSPNMGSYKESVTMRDHAFGTNFLGAGVDEDILISDSLPVDEISARKLHEDLQTQGHSLANKLSYRESYVDIRIQGDRPVYKLSATESCEDIQIQDHLIIDKTLARGLYKEEEKDRFHPSHRDIYPMVTSHYMMPLAQSKAFSSISMDDSHGPYKNSQIFPSDGFSHETNTEPFGWDGNRDGQVSGFRYSSKPELGLRKQVQLIPTECKVKNYHCPELWRDEKRNLGILSSEFYGEMENVGQDWDHRDLARGSIVDSVVEGIDEFQSPYSNHTRDIRLSDYLNSSQEPPNNKNLDASKTRHGKRLDGDVLGSRGTCFNFETEVYQDSESIHQVRGYDLERNADPCPYEERLPDIDHDPAFDDCPQLSFALEDPGIHDLSGYRLKRKRGTDKEMSKYLPKSKLSSNRKTSTKVCNLSSKNEGRASEHIGDSFLSKKSIWSRTSDDLSGIQNRTSQPCKHGSKDIKKRLAPGPQNGHVSHHVIRKHKPHKFHNRSLDGSYGSLLIERVPLKTKVSAASSELEGSEEFKQQVNSMFLKFVKLLNENPAQRRIYTEQRKDGNLKCSVCGRKSKEFTDTIGLVMHTIMSSKVGLRARHLGLFKALCLLMGWNSEVTPNKPWVHQALPVAESLALKEDLIIWPPVVIVHNSSIGNNNPDERMIVTNDMLETILRAADMGFDGGKTKIHRGKPANQSIMVVRFNGNFSGLQKAEKLHHIYAENQHGRAELQQTKSNNAKTGGCEENQKAKANKMEHVLYGYLGIAGDLDKLDFETKERSVVKSKKEIQAIADASLVNE